METSTITGIIYIDFDTDKKITKEQFKQFKNKLDRLVDDWEMMIYDTANSCGFEANSVHPIVLEELELEEELFLELELEL